MKLSSIVVSFRIKKHLMDHGRIMYGGRSRQLSPEWRSGKRKLTGMST
jgi:hypothetical protein